MKHHLIPIRMAIICWRGCEEKGTNSSCTVGGNINQYSHYREQDGGSLKN